MSKYRKIQHPNNNTFNYGFVPALAELDTERAPIYLFTGEHFGGGAGKGRGFGEAHILAAHAKDMQKAGCRTVAEYIALFVKEGIPICSEGGYSSKTRVLAMRRNGMIVVLEYRETREEALWSIITAYKRPQALSAKELCKVEGEEDIEMKKTAE